MGKKSKFKEIRRLAREIPTIPSIQNVRLHKTGAELLKDGVKEVGGKPVKEDGDYTATQKVGVATNHNRKMKKLYNKMGHTGAKAYMRDVNNYLQNEVDQRNANNQKLAEGQA